MVSRSAVSFFRRSRRLQEFEISVSSFNCDFQERCHLIFVIVYNYGGQKKQTTADWETPPTSPTLSLSAGLSEWRPAGPPQAGGLDPSPPSASSSPPPVPPTDTARSAGAPGEQKGERGKITTLDSAAWSSRLNVESRDAGDWMTGGSLSRCVPFRWCYLLLLCNSRAINSHLGLFQNCKARRQR